MAVRNDAAGYLPAADVEDCAGQIPRPKRVTVKRSGRDYLDLYDVTFWRKPEGEQEGKDTVNLSRASTNFQKQKILCRVVSYDDFLSPGCRYRDERSKDQIPLYSFLFSRKPSAFSRGRKLLNASFDKVDRRTTIWVKLIKGWIKCTVKLYEKWKGAFRRFSLLLLFTKFYYTIV